MHSSLPENRDLQALIDLSQQLLGSHDLQTLTELVLDRAIMLGRFDLGYIRLVNAQRGTYDLVAMRGFRDPEAAQGRERLATDDPRFRTTSQVIATGTITVVENIAASGRFRILRGEAAETVVSVPLRANGGVLGAISLGSRAPRKFEPAELHLLEVIGGQLGLAIQKARLYEDEQRRRQQLEAIRLVTAELTRELDLTALLGLIARRAVELVGVKVCTIYLWDENQKLLVPEAWAGDRDWSKNLRWRLGQGVSGMAAQQRVGIISNDYRSSTFAHPVTIERSDATAVLAAPIIYQERLVGTITVNNERTYKSFTEQDLDLLGIFADQAAIAIENARLFEQVGTVEALHELGRLKGEFLNTVSHELRTPLSLIHGYAELMVHRRDTLSSSEMAEMASEIHASSTVMARLVDDLLDFSRLEHERFRLQRQIVVVADQLQQLVGGFQRQPGGERISLECSEELTISADPQRFAQIVGNLLSNALNYAPEGPVLVRATSHQEELLRVEVIDQGPGIPPDEQPRVWERFYRGSMASRAVQRGSGLGLALVKHLVELHGGDVGLRSAPGAGTTVWFTVPLCEAAPAQARSRASRSCIESRTDSGTATVPGSLVASAKPGTIGKP